MFLLSERLRRLQRAASSMWFCKSIAFLCSQLHADRELDSDLSLQKLTSIEAQLQDCVAALASDRRGKHSSDVVASPDRRVKCVRSLSAVAPAPACSEDNKLEKANQTIGELRTQRLAVGYGCSHSGA